MNTELSYKRTGRVLHKKMNALLLPSLLTTAATSLNEFVDSLLMSNLLGSTAMAIINYCFCIMLFYAMVQCLFGYGGSIIYARKVGEKHVKEAQQTFCESMCTSILISILIVVAGLLLKNNIARLLCDDTTLLPELNSYLLPVILSAPLVIVINSLSYFLPIFGQPNLSMFLVIVANVVNLFMDYAYVRFFHLGVEAAGWATLTGYVVSVLILLVLIVLKKCIIPLKIRFFHSLNDLYIVLKTGLPQALFQICFAIQSVYGNHVASSLGGQPALIAFSLQTQIQSMTSIVLCGISSTMSGFIAILHSQHDHIGIKYIMKSSIVMMTVFTLICFVILEVYPQCILLIYGIVEPEMVAITKVAIRIFVVTYIFRSISMLLRTYLNSCGYDYYAMGISLVDSLIGILLWSNILMPFFGLTGLWLTYPVNAIILLIGILIINIVMEKTHPECKGILLLKDDPDVIDQMNITILDEDDVISSVGEQVQLFCEKHAMEKRKAVMAGLLVEEMCVFSSTRNKKSLFIDIMLNLYKDCVVVEFRSLGEPANPLLKEKEDIPENIRILQKASSTLEYDYSLCMNSTKLTLNI